MLLRLDRAILELFAVRGRNMTAYRTAKAKYGLSSPSNRVRPANAPEGAAGIPDPEGDAALAEFLAADIVVIGAPMYNFAVPHGDSFPSAVIWKVFTIRV